MTQPPRYVPVPLPGPAEVTQTDRSAQKASKAPQTNPEKRTSRPDKLTAGAPQGHR